MQKCHLDQVIKTPCLNALPPNSPSSSGPQCCTMVNKSTASVFFCLICGGVKVIVTSCLFAVNDW